MEAWLCAREPDRPFDGYEATIIVGGTKPMTNNITTTELESGRCIEVCDGGRLIGYSIFFSGGWDGWACNRSGPKVMRQVLHNSDDPAKAIESILKFHGMQPTKEPTP